MELQNYQSISELTREIKNTLENSFDSLKVIGEISNFKAHVSGHWYFTLKDADAQISCTMWRGKNNYVFFTPQDGMKVTVSGRINVYLPRGSYQIDVNSMQPAGEGELQAAFERLKAKLSEEGLFEVEHKKPVPRFPEKIGVVTASDGAAFRDMVSVASRRYPIAEIVLFPSKVQGEGAATDIAAGIHQLNQLDDIDVIIIGRGGGSLEDLWAFNEEIVARAVFSSVIPVIRGVGHEIDFTIADFVADLRAPTPSAAMEMATPGKDEVFAFIDEFSYNSTTNILDMIENRSEKIKRITSSYGFKSPLDLVKNRFQFLDNLVYRLQNNLDSIVTKKRNNINYLAKVVETNDVSRTLKKGFSLIRQNGKLVKRAAEFIPDTDTKIQFYDNEITLK